MLVAVFAHVDSSKFEAVEAVDEIGSIKDEQVQHQHGELIHNERLEPNNYARETMEKDVPPREKFMRGSNKAIDDKGSESKRDLAYAHGYYAKGATYYHKGVTQYAKGTTYYVAAKGTPVVAKGAKGAKGYYTHTRTYVTLQRPRRYSYSYSKGKGKGRSRYYGPYGYYGYYGP